MVDESGATAEELARVERIATWYLNEQVDVDVRMIGFRYRTLAPHLHGSTCLEMGPAEGQMTRLLVDDFEQLTVVEGSAELLDAIEDRPNLHKVHAIFEEFEPGGLFDTIVLEHVLEHVLDPVALLRSTHDWLAPGGRLLVGVPNADSFHRLAAVKMGLLDAPESLNERDLAIGHRRVYSPGRLRADLEVAGFRVTAHEGVFFKSLSVAQMATWSDEMFEGFFALGHDFADHAAEILMVAERA